MNVQEESEGSDNGEKNDPKHFGVLVLALGIAGSIGQNPPGCSILDNKRERSQPDEPRTAH